MEVGWGRRGFGLSLRSVLLFVVGYVKELRGRVEVV